MVRVMKLRYFVACLAVCVVSGWGIKRAQSAAIIPVPVADYRDDYQAVSFPSGWSYQWNSAGAIGNAANYTDMVWNGAAYASEASPGLPDPAPANYLHLNPNGGHPGYAAGQAPSGGITRYPIAAFTVTQDANYSISDSFWTIANSSAFETDVLVYVNDTLINTVTLPAGGGTTSFNGELGALVGGDTIYVAEGALTNTNFGSFQWDFTINRLAEVPEPSTLILAGIALLPVLRHRRSRKMQA